MKQLFKRISATLAIGLMALGLFVYPIQTANALGRDCDSNAIIYCGFSTREQFKSKLTSGTGKQYQSATELQALFGRYGIYTKDINNLSLGRVTRDNRVILWDGRVVKTNAYSMGRSYMPGSTKVSGLPYPVYLRHPSVSFRSESIPAYIHMNPDGTFGYAVIMSCGNIVPGTIYAEPLYKLNVWKYEDLNRDGARQTNEPFLPNWTFDVTGPNGLRRTFTTLANGGQTITHLPKGTYTVTERQQSGWTATTGQSQTVTISDRDPVLYFGNARVVIVQDLGLRVVKFHDLDGDATRDAQEPALSGWRFRVTGPNTNTILTTDASGVATLGNLNAGSYTVTEILTEGWENTTGLSRTEAIAEGEVQTYLFGNRRIDEPETPGGEVTPTKLPSSGPVETAAMAFGTMSFSGAALAWARSKKRLLDAFRK